LEFFAPAQILYENSKHALMDTCLALALFRAEISPSVLAMFGGLLFCKVFHWLSKSRLEHVSCLRFAMIPEGRVPVN
jgi:E3 ubiquitin-protein ligase synoviolin